jgi:organic radical activating enzyme
LAAVVRSYWPPDRAGRPFVVCTGGEPALQLDPALIDAFRSAGFDIAIETNGTLEIPPSIDWVTVSPKGRSALRLRNGHEVKVVWPQEGINLDELEELDFGIRYLQPLANEHSADNTRACVEMCLRRPGWRLSLQTHKLLGIR